MTHDEARDEMLAIIKLMGANENVPITYTDVPAQVPNNDTVWARVTVRHATGTQGSLTGGLGTTLYDRGGTLWVQVYAPRGDGSVAGYGKAEAFQNAIQDWKGAVWFRNVRVEEAGADGAYERVDVKADFEYQDVR
jgi:hypothetical protein